MMNLLSKELYHTARRHIASELPLLGPEVRWRAESTEAYQLYLKGRYYWNKRPRDIQKGIDYFERAIARDPNYALAYSGLADSYSSLGSWDGSDLPPRPCPYQSPIAKTRAFVLAVSEYCVVNPTRRTQGGDRLVPGNIHLKKRNPNVGAWAASRLLRSFLFQVEPFDPLVLTLAVATIFLLALAASVLPAGRAASIDPMQALRME